MGICWSSLHHEQKSYPIISRPGASPNLNQDISVHASDSSCQTVASTNFTTWVSQVSSSLTSFGTNNQTSREIVDEVLSNGGIIGAENLRVFTYTELKVATRKFRSDMVVGRGGYGKVYKGGLKEKDSSGDENKLVIAVKTLDTRSRQGFKQWLAEVNILGRLSHPNLVKLLGYCLENGKFFIVYEFVEKGSLNYHLFGKGSARPLPWRTRFQIAIGMAQGLAYMHTQNIIHRDFKSSNVLLNKLYEAKISDFGLAFLSSSGGTSGVQTSVLGTYGYSAPEIIKTGSFDQKSDVYSFGVVLVEMLTGLRSIDKKRPKGQQILVNWVIPYLSRKPKLKKVMDSRLKGKYPYREASEIAQLAIRCLHSEPQFRPSMKEIAETMEQIEAFQHKRKRK